jgi:PKD repeat protein
LHQDIICLNTGCYTFSIFDNVGDGICGGYGVGYFSIIETSSETVIATGCDYGIGMDVDFCVEIDEGEPLANFVHGSLNSCTGEVQFFDASVSNPEVAAWIWDFGDGHTSTEQNPVHSYSLNGYYTVSLEVTNANGSHILTVPNYIEIARDNPPFIADQYFCEFGGTIVFNVPDGYSDFYWYINPENETPDYVGDDYTIEDITEDITTYYQYVFSPESQYVGLEDNKGVGGYFNFSIDRAVYFDAFEDLTILSAKVYANGTAARTITLKNSGGTVLDSRTINIPDGESIIDLNFEVPQGNDYAIHVSLSNNLSYTGDYDGPNVGYPFTISDLISFTGNNYSDSFWYFFYNIEVVEGNGEECASAIAPLMAIRSTPEFALGNDTVICFGSTIELYPDSEFSDYLWQDETSTFSLSATDPGTYSLTVTDEYSCTAENSILVEKYEELVYSVVSEPYFDDFYGSATVEVLSGSEPVDISWSCDSTSFAINLLLPGTYYFTLIDDNGCFYNDSVVIEDFSRVYSINNYEDFVAYPNPVTDVLYVETYDTFGLEISITDISGRVVKSVNCVEGSLSIDVSEFIPGTYLVEVRNEHKNKVFKLIKE